MKTLIIHEDNRIYTYSRYKDECFRKKDHRLMYFSSVEWITRLEITYDLALSLGKKASAIAIRIARYLGKMDSYYKKLVEEEKITAHSEKDDIFWLCSDETVLRDSLKHYFIGHNELELIIADQELRFEQGNIESVRENGKFLLCEDSDGEGIVMFSQQIDYLIERIEEVGRLHEVALQFKNAK